jgi:hypothetical protein
LPRAFTTAEKDSGQAQRLGSEDVRLPIVTDHPDFCCLRECFKDDAEGSGMGLLITQLGGVEDGGETGRKVEMIQDVSEFWDVIREQDAGLSGLSQSVQGTEGVRQESPATWIDAETTCGPGQQ